MNKHMRTHCDVVAADGDVSKAEGIAEKYGLSRDYVANWIAREKRDAVPARASQ